MASLAFRQATPDDAPFVVSSWVDSYRGAHAAGMIPMPEYERVYREAVCWVLGRPGVRVIVAHHPDGDLYGWIALEHDVSIPEHTRVDGRWVDRLAPAGCPLVHYVYVKQPYRRLGIAKALLKEAGLDPRDKFLYTCKTAVISHLDLPHAKWMPLVARYPKAGGSSEAR